ncbi:hypothetical protein FACS1894102_2430 [Spirochaetia bacterium]|nr:hypothetical protein FACS1894102_2430 [Spirochaetia bacterium]
MPKVAVESAEIAVSPLTSRTGRRNKYMQQVAESSKLINKISTMMEQSRRPAVAKVYGTLNMLFWNVGTRINTEILKSKKMQYNKSNRRSP